MRLWRLFLVVSAMAMATAMALTFAGSGSAASQSQTPASSAKALAEVHSLKITILSTMLADEGIGEWGFAALVEADGKKILFDTGARPNTVLDNAKELKIDLGDVQDVILSHFHADHTTGLMILRRELAKDNAATLSRVHVGKGIFLERRGRGSNPMIAMKIDYEATGGKFIEHDKPEEIVPGVWLTGPIPRVYPEKNYPKGTEVATSSGWMEDNLPEDQSGRMWPCGHHQHA
jgi:7,8-dihydropterin-6-yl-methyl-4-(beta-D-ribofuranosyl)aminobenzene 5'-phosphate synthase